MLTEERKTSDFQEKEDIQLMNLEEFCDWYPDGFFGRFELHNGVVFEMQPTGTHEQVAGFLIGELIVEIKRLNFQPCGRKFG